jgi:hypothetical protein
MGPRRRRKTPKRLRRGPTQLNIFNLIFFDFFACNTILKATGLTVTVTRAELGNATDPSVTVTVAYIQVSTVLATI